MNRRQYLLLGAAAGTVGVAGCTGTGSDEQFPPYPDSESTEFSGEGDTETDSFEILNDGPTLLDVAHEGDEAFGVSILTDEEQPAAVDSIPPVTGPYSGVSIHSVEPDTYSLDIEASGEWTATVYDLPAYEDGTGLSLPLDREGAFGAVIGPIDFAGATVEFDIRFESTDSVNRALLINRDGETAGALFDSQQMDLGNETGVDEDGTNQTLEVDGVGYLAIESTTGWSASMSTES